MTTVSKPVLSVEGFDKLVSKAVDESLAVLGEPSKAIIYKYLTETLNFKKWEIPHHIDYFEKVLEKIFGDGAFHIESLIKKNLKKKMDSTCILVELSAYFDTASMYNRFKKEKPDFP